MCPPENSMAKKTTLSFYLPENILLNLTTYSIFSILRTVYALGM